MWRCWWCKKSPCGDSDHENQESIHLMKIMKLWWSSYSTTIIIMMINIHLLIMILIMLRSHSVLPAPPSLVRQPSQPPRLLKILTLFSMSASTSSPSLSPSLAPSLSSMHHPILLNDWKLISTITITFHVCSRFRRSFQCQLQRHPHPCHHCYHHCRNHNHYLFQADHLWRGVISKESSMTDCILSCGSVGFSAHTFVLVSGINWKMLQMVHNYTWS